jgi:excisionase family DNA binding protein
MSERALALNEAASHMGWSRRTLTRALARHGIPTIGTGRRARLEAADLAFLKKRATAEETLGVIYCLQAAEGTPVKIGFSRAAEIQQRIRALQTGSPYPLRLLGSVPAFALQELSAHVVLRDHRLSGEWFEWSEPVRQFVAAIQSGLNFEAALAAAKATK